LTKSCYAKSAEERKVKSGARFSGGNRKTIKGSDGLACERHGEDKPATTPGMKRGCNATRVNRKQRGGGIDDRLKAVQWPPTTDK